MRIVSLAEIQSVVSFPAAVEAVRQGFIDYAEGLIEQPDPMQILFPKADGGFFGDCHAKAAQARGRPYFVLKIATGFYDNAALGLPVNNGLVLVMSAETGQPVAVLQDKGWLTQIRTAAAGALAASLKPVGADTTLGIVGSGTQARYQAQMIGETLGIRRVLIQGRTQAKSEARCAQLRELGLRAEPVSTARELCHAADIVVTTTPSTEPVLRESDLPEQLHIVAVGADSPGKLELAPEVLAHADLIATDSHAQCLQHGDFGAAVRAGVVSDCADLSFPALLAGQHPEVDFSAVKRSVVDLTGLGAQDLAIASLVVDQLR